MPRASIETREYIRHSVKLIIRTLGEPPIFSSRISMTETGSAALFRSGHSMMAIHGGWK